MKQGIPELYADTAGGWGALLPLQHRVRDSKTSADQSIAARLVPAVAERRVDASLGT